LLHQVVAADDFSPRVPGLFLLVAFSEDQDPHLDTGAMRQHDGSPHHLIRSFRIDAEAKGHFDRFIKLGIRRALHHLDGFLQAIQLVTHRCFRCLPLLAHRESPYSTVIPILRAVPAIIRLAAARSAALRSGNFARAISCTWAAETLATFSLFGVPDPLMIPAAFFNKSDAGDVLTMKVKLRSV